MNQIKLIVLDVDGVLTDGKLYIGSDGEEYKCIPYTGWDGYQSCQVCRNKVCDYYRENIKAVSKRAEELKMDYVFQGISEKIKVLEEIREKTGIQLNEICYVGEILMIFLF